MAIWGILNQNSGINLKDVCMIGAFLLLDIF